MAKQTVKRILGFSRKLKSKSIISALNDGDYLIGDVPYQCQFATPRLTKDILDRKIKAKDDPNWAIFGFKTKEESEYWAWRDCGICCVKMVLDYFGNNRTIAQLVEEGVALKGYDIEKDYGWYYKPLLQLAEKYGLKGFTTSYLSKDEVARHIRSKRFVIASVNPSIIRLDEGVKSRQKSGHLVLVIGFKVIKGRLSGFYVNNPSGKVPEMRKKAFVPIKTFSEAYGERGIVIG